MLRDLVAPKNKQVKSVAFRAWWRNDEFEPLNHSVDQLVEWTEEYGVTKRRYRHYMAALFDFVTHNQTANAKQLLQYMKEMICVMERIQDFDWVIAQAKDAGQVEAARSFVVYATKTGLIDTSECLSAMKSLRN